MKTFLTRDRSTELKGMDRRTGKKGLLQQRDTLQAGDCHISRDDMGDDRPYRDDPYSHQGLN